MNVNLKLATLKRRQDLEYDVIEIIGRLYDQVTLKMAQQTSSQSSVQIDTTGTYQGSLENGSIDHVMSEGK